MPNSINTAPMPKRRIASALVAALLALAALIAIAPGTASAEDSYGRLINGNGHCLDLDHGIGPAILHWTCNGQANQRWKLTKNPNANMWEIKPASYPTQCADVRGNVGPDIIKYNCKLSENQLWYRVGNTFRSYLNYNKCLDASGTSTKALLWTCNGQPNQSWRLAP
jgi:hypothetical protein